MGAQVPVWPLVLAGPPEKNKGTLMGATLPPKQVAASAGALVTAEEGDPQEDSSPEVEAGSPLKKPRPQA